MGSNTDDGTNGYAEVVLTFTGTPGSTYTATGINHAIAVLVVEQFTKTLYEDPYNMGNAFEEGPTAPYPDYFDWYGPGPDEQVKTAGIRLGEVESEPATYQQKPTSLKVLSVTVLATGTTGNSGCNPSTTGDYGIALDIKYQVLDQAQPPQPILKSGMVPKEIVQGVGGVTGPQNIGPSGNSNNTGTTASDGTFHDAPFLMCSFAPFSNANILQIIYIDFDEPKSQAK
jgi:hypothetical protein